MIERLETLQWIKETGLVAVIRGIPADKVPALISSLYDGGVRVMEITMDSEDALDLIKSESKKYKGKAAVGAGTVLDAGAGLLAVQAGASFLFAPALDKETIEVANRYGRVVIPGVFTPTEALQAVTWGADIVKFFPADAVGSKFIKGFKGPLNHISIMPTGGVSIDNVEEFIKAGAIAVGAGGSLFKNEWVEDNKWDAITDHAKNFVTTIQAAKK